MAPLNGAVQQEARSGGRRVTRGHWGGGAQRILGFNSRDLVDQFRELGLRKVGTDRPQARRDV